MTYAVLVASSRSDSNTRLLAEAAFARAQGGYEDLSALHIGYYAHDFANEGDDFFPLIQRLLDSELWVLSTPLYWYTMSAQCKTFLDRFTDLLEIHKPEGRLLRGKSLAVVCSGTNVAMPSAFDEPFALTCNYLGMRFLGSHYAQFSADGVISDAAARAAAGFGARCLAQIGEARAAV